MLAKSVEVVMTNGEGNAMENVMMVVAVVSVTISNEGGDDHGRWVMPLDNMVVLMVKADVHVVIVLSCKDSGNNAVVATVSGGGGGGRARWRE